MKLRQGLAGFAGRAKYREKPRASKFLEQINKTEAGL